MGETEYKTSLEKVLRVVLSKLWLIAIVSVAVAVVMAVMGEVKMLGAISYTEKEFDTCIELIAANKINVDKYIDAKVSLEEVQDSLVRLTSGKDAAVKIIVKP